MTQVVTALVIAMVFMGLSVQIARFHSQSRRGAYRHDKYTCAELWLKWKGGLCTRGAYGQDSTVHTKVTNTCSNMYTLEMK